MTNWTVVALLLGFTGVFAAGVLLESYTIKRVGNAIGSAIPFRQAAKITLLKTVYALCLGHAVGYLIAVEQFWGAGALAGTGLCVTPVLYKRFMAPSATWWQAVWVAMLAPILYTVGLLLALLALLVLLKWLGVGQSGA